ncbi:PQQ-binding-like beta-propeller repeat protein [Acidiferrobacter sp.]|uniref:outer membrane protein assembly factor BamB family protein n=1 Tax=Acidiferrobacter sp. TaxID=1872107 RepID=UPI002606E120|nr:PQQ-binding-like beta-propeller repeat protein [Acidiferrobacter sp.]
MEARPAIRPSVVAGLAALALLSGCSHKASQTASASSSKTALVSPHAWPLYGLNAAHNARYKAPQGAVGEPVQWVFHVPGAVPNGMKKAAIKRTYVTITAVRDLVGIPIGASVADGNVYVPDDNGFLYALDGSDGHMLWKFNALNQIMTTPLVAGRGAKKLVYVGGGDSNFSYTQAVKFGHKGAAVVRGTDISGIYAVHAATGKLAWVYHTKGEDMPTPAIDGGMLVFGNGDGHIYGLNAATGKFKWRTPIKSFVSMSSATVYHNLVIVGGTHPSALYAVNAKTGKLAWRTAPQAVFSSSMGDCAPAQSRGIVVTQFERKAKGQRRAKSVEIALDAKTGKILWQTTLGVGKVPPRNKDAVPMIVGGAIYTGSPVTATAYAVQLKTGKVLWHTPLKIKMKAAPSVTGPDVIFPVGNGAIFVLNRKSGKVLSKYMTHHGGFGPQNGVVMGDTYLIGSNFGWMYALPVKTLLGQGKTS